MSWAIDPVTELLKHDAVIGNIIANLDYNYPSEKMLLAAFVLYYDFSNVQKIFILRDCIRGISDTSTPFFNWKLRATMYFQALEQPELVESFNSFFEKGYIDCMLFLLREITKTYELKLTDQTKLFINLIVVGNMSNNFCNNNNLPVQQNLPLIRTTPIHINFTNENNKPKENNSSNLFQNQNTQLQNYTIPKTCISNVLDVNYF